ncbi:MAG: hypothetical protein JKY15_05520, partial [Deltaproteobacteria bacterium]|nr:hypothetical protein [Deltaproteobacteria bacterium]
MLSWASVAYHIQKTITKGIYHNLRAIYDELNGQYFANNVDADILWGRHSTFPGRRRSIKLGHYCYDNKHIVIHPALDQASV